MTERLAIPLPAYTVVNDTDLYISPTLYAADPAAWAAINAWFNDHGMNPFDAAGHNHIVRDLQNQTITYTRHLTEHAGSPTERAVHQLDREPDPFPTVLVRWPLFPDRDDLAIAAQGAKVSAEEMLRLRTEVAEIVRVLQQPLVVPDQVRADVGDDAIAFTQGAMTGIARSLDKALHPVVDEQDGTDG